jgi:hypothetical protein
LLPHAVNYASYTYQEGEVMQYRRLGHTGLKVSEFCLGCMTFGGQADEETLLRIMER